VFPSSLPALGREFFLLIDHFLSGPWPYSINSLTIGRDYILIGYYAASDDDHVFDASPFYR